MDGGTFQHLALLRRSAAISEEYGVSVETSLYRSNVTGMFLLEEVQHGRNGTSTNTVTLSPALVAEFLPLLAQIAEGDGGG